MLDCWMRAEGIHFTLEEGARRKVAGPQLGCSGQSEVRSSPRAPASAKGFGGFTLLPFLQRRQGTPNQLEGTL
jgi:hypothetical protein